jgi:hypothetical protein
VSERAILSVSYIGVAAGRGLPKDVGGFLRYLQYRDRHRDVDNAHDVDGLLRYIAHRDGASPEGRLFDEDSTAGDEKREELATFIRRSTEETRRQGGPRSSTNNRAYYRMILSPEDARGLDLRALTRSTLDELARDAGTGGLPLWIAAEHRNTRHPHVHIVMAGRREVSPGRFRTLLITDARLERMKAALQLGMTQQRETRSRLLGTALRAGEARSKSLLHDISSPSPSPVPTPGREHGASIDISAWSENGHRDAWVGRQTMGAAALRVAALAGRMARHYLREAEDDAEQRQQPSRSLGRGRGE